MYHLADGLSFMSSLADESVDGIFTDPPWGSGPAIAGQSEWKELIDALAQEARRVLKPSGRCMVWVGMRQLGPTIEVMSRHLQYQWTVFVHYIPRRYVAHFEALLDPILIFSIGDLVIRGQQGAKLRQVYTCSTVKRTTPHPCAKPLASVKHILADWFAPDEYVIDPFAGSDTTGRAARELGLKWDSCEIDPVMYLTGQKRHEQTVMEFANGRGGGGGTLKP